jgi:hypothetical protein
MGIKNFTHPYREWQWCDSVTLSLCDSVCNKRSNISAAFHLFGPKNFCVHLGKKVWLKINIFWPRAGWAAAGGQKNGDLSGYLEPVESSSNAGGSLTIDDRRFQHPAYVHIHVHI